jgi:hypothetical protein
MSDLASYIKSSVGNNPILEKLAQKADITSHLSAALERVANARAPGLEADTATADIGVEIMREVEYDGRKMETVQAAPAAFEAFSRAVRSAVFEHARDATVKAAAEPSTSIEGPLVTV